ncbi:phosphoenolpyruvate--protein phosphotransferase [Desulfosarcina sp. OttesenSCG-928-A07]|nr:phosphoenolpyruvate--protein phosphotransferase [Desulfosarcina sp. OttesenSCG-928-G17]MDL2329856.1 phosphoenolpyruvate--protein phosphotransferase [Desulfosarcina sp. OttesenSCG-928-A07]
MHADSASPDVIVLLAPLSGPIVPVTEVPDPAFAQKMVGDGIAIDPVSEVLLSPCEGTVTQLHSAGHAITIATPEGVDVLMHIGLETVLLKGKGFSPKAAVGDRVRPGDPLIAFDASYIAHHAASLLTLMLVVNQDRVAEYRPASGMAEAGRSPVLELVLNAAVQNGKDAPDDHFAAVASEPIVILNPAGLHARPAAVLVNTAKQFQSDLRIAKNGKSANAKSLVAIMTLAVKQHDSVILSASGPDASAALEALVPLISSGLGENLHTLPVKAAPVPSRRESSDPHLLLGVAASPGLVTGQIYQLRHAAISVEERGKGKEAENQALLAALSAAKGELAHLQNAMRQRADTDKAAIFAAHQELLEDPELLDAAAALIEQGKSAAFAWQASFTRQADALSGLNNELLAGRANDIRDIGRRVLLRLSGESPEKHEMPVNAILVAEDLTPSDTANLDKTRVAGFCTTAGSATSHASILARSLSIPAIAAIETRALDLPNGQSAVLDGEKGELRLSPSKEEVARIRRLQEEAAEARKIELAEAKQPAITKDGRQIKVVGNIGGAAEAEEIPSLGGEGVGLLRSEFLFLQRADAPDTDEQAAVYKTIAKTLGPDRDLVVRTLDVGGDKPLAYLPMAAEVNPFLGVRGIRLNLLGTDLFRSQVQAILSAAPFTRLHVMFPMVSTVEELRDARKIVEEEKRAQGVTALVQVGIMVEVPSAALLAENLAREADFFSIGTNDLTQYTLAIDRGHPRLAKMADALHPAVLRLIAETVKGAHAHGKWVGVCGGLAGEIPAVPVLLGLGVDELSVSVSAIPAVKAAVRRQQLTDCEQLAAEVLRMLTVSEVRARLAAFAQTNKEVDHV